LKVLSSPVEPNEPPQDLTPASRRQDHTTSPSASSAVVLHAANRSRRAIRPALASHAQHCRVHRIPPRVRDDRDTPLVWDETAAVIEVIWVGVEQQNFLLWDSTAAITPNLARRAVDFFTRRHSASRRKTREFSTSGKSPRSPFPAGCLRGCDPRESKSCRCDCAPQEGGQVLINGLQNTEDVHRLRKGFGGCDECEKRRPVPSICGSCGRLSGAYLWMSFIT
jgi:hypothetical protein